MQIATPEDILPGYDAPQVDSNGICGVLPLHVVAEEPLQHQVIPLIPVAAEAAGLDADDRRLVSVVAHHGLDVVADHVGSAAGDNDVKIAVDNLQRIAHLLIQPVDAAEDDLLLADIGTGHRHAAAEARAQIAGAAILVVVDAPAAAQGRVENRHRPRQRGDGHHRATQGAKGPRPFDKGTNRGHRRLPP